MLSDMHHVYFQDAFVKNPLCDLGNKLETMIKKYFFKQFFDPR